MKTKNFLLSLKALALVSLFFAAGCKKSNDAEQTKLSDPQARAKFVLDSVLVSTPTSITDVNGVRTLTYKDGHQQVTGISEIKDKLTESANSTSGGAQLFGAQEPRDWFENIGIDAPSVPYSIALGAQWILMDGLILGVTSMTMVGTPPSNTEILPDGTTITVNRTLIGQNHTWYPLTVPTTSKTLKWKAGLSIRVTVKPPGGTAESNTTGQALEYTRILTGLRWN